MMIYYRKEYDEKYNRQQRSATLNYVRLRPLYEVKTWII